MNVDAQFANAIEYVYYRLECVSYLNHLNQLHLADSMGDHT